MTDAPRSPAKIPLIRISQTESVERAERNPPTPMTDPPSLEVIFNKNELSVHHLLN
jgi:hypothetical protein